MMARHRHHQPLTSWRGYSGFDLEPPDQGLGAGNGYVVNFVNVTGQIQSTSGALLVRPFYLNTFFHEAPQANTSDPRGVLRRG